MQEDVARSLCLLAFLLSNVRANQNSQDLSLVPGQSHLFNNAADLSAAAIPLENRRFQELEDQEQSNSFNSNLKSGAIRLQDRRASGFEGQQQFNPLNAVLRSGADPHQDRKTLTFEGQEQSNYLNADLRSGAIPFQDQRTLGLEGQEQSQPFNEDLRSGAPQDGRFHGFGSLMGLPNSGFAPFAHNSAPSGPYGSLYAQRPGYSASMFGNAEATAQAQAIAEGGTLAQAQSQAQSLATAQTVAKGFATNPSLISPGLYNTFPTSNAVSAPIYSGVAANLIPGLGFGKHVHGGLSQVEVPANVLFDAPSVVYGNDSSAVSLAGARSRVIQPSEYIQPHLLPGGENIVTCTRPGQQHYLWLPNHNCMICSCIQQFTSLVAICVGCAGCASIGPDSEIVPSVPEFITPVPIPQPQDQGSCSPLPTDEPFQNPLDPCQVCICTKVFNLDGKPDVHVKCEESPLCVIPPGVKPLPPSPVTPVPFLPESLQPELVPIQPIVTVPLKDFEPLPPSIGQLEPIVSTPFPVPQPNELIPWPPQPLPGPLPGPRPHDSCRPYPPNQYFLHPWDSCQMCICTEASVLGLVSVEVDCQTRKECQCVELDVPQQSLAPSISNQLKYLDEICRFRSFGAEFTHPQDSCRLCSCEHFSNLIVPVCRRSNKPECVPSVPLPSEEIIFIEPKCRHQPPNQPFLTDCKVCSCNVVFNYVVARCSPSPDCASTVTPGTIAYTNAETAALAHALTSPRPSSQPTAIPLSYLSGSQSLAEASASAHSSSISQGSQSQYPFSYPFGRNPSLAESSGIAQSSVLAQDSQSPYVVPQTYQSLVPSGSSYSESHANANAFGSSSMYNPVQLPSQYLGAEGAQDSQSLYVVPQTYQSLVPSGSSYSESHANANAFGSSSMYNPVQLPSQHLGAEGAQDSQSLYIVPQTYQSLVPSGSSYSESHANANAFGSSSMYNPVQFPSQHLGAEFVNRPGYVLPSDATVLNQPHISQLQYSLNPSQGYPQNVESPYIYGSSFYPQGGIKTHPYTGSASANSIAASALYPDLYPQSSNQVTGLYSPVLKSAVDHGDLDPHNGEK